VRNNVKRREIGRSRKRKRDGITRRKEKRKEKKKGRKEGKKRRILPRVGEFHQILRLA
jgi:hypothetical protein